MSKRYLSKKDLSEYVGVSIGKVEIMMKDGLVYSKLGRNVRFDIQDVEQFINQNKVI